MNRFYTKLLSGILFVASAITLHAQNVGINTTGALPSTNSILDLNTGNSNNLGFIAPSVSLTALGTFNPPIVGAATAGDVGMLVYNTNAAVGSGVGYYYWDGAKWQAAGSTIGGAGTLNYLAKWTPNGTTLGIGLTYDNGTSVGIGANNPLAELEVFASGAWTNLENNITNGIQISTGHANGDYTLYMGADKPNQVVYIQGVRYGCCFSPLLLNARGGYVGIGTSTPQQALEIGALTNTERIDGLKTGGTYNNALATKSDIMYADDANGDLHSLPAPAVASTLVSSATGVLSWQNGVVPTGSGTLNYLARWTPTGTQLGIGMVQDNNATVGINTAPVGTAMLTVTNSTATDYGIVGQNSAASGNAVGTGILGTTAQSGGVGVWGRNFSTTAGGVGVFGNATGAAGIGVDGVSTISGGIGVVGSNSTTAGLSVGVEAYLGALTAPTYPTGVYASVVAPNSGAYAIEGYISGGGTSFGPAVWGNNSNTGNNIQTAVQGSKLGNTGTGTGIGIYGLATGTAASNTGGYFTASGGTLNHGVDIAAGDLALNNNAGTLGQVLTSAGPNVLPTWSAPVTSATAWQLIGNTGITHSTSAIGTPANNNFIGTTNPADFVMVANGFERMRIANGLGYVGISNTAPTTLLQIGNAATTTGKVSIYSQDFFDGQFQIGNPIANSEASMQFISGVTAFGGAAASSLGNNYMWNMGAGTYGNGGNTFSIANVGLGRPIITILANGNVGIGNVAASQNLSVQNGENIDMAGTNNGFLNNGFATGNGLTFGIASGEGIASKRTGGGNQFGLDFYTGFVNRMSLTNGGFLGIGTTAPGQQLEVASTTSTVRIDGIKTGNTYYSTVTAP